MDFKEFLAILLQALIVAGTPILFGFIINLVRQFSAKIKGESTNVDIRSSIDMIEDIVVRTVSMVSQTYVDTLKKENRFSKDNQVEAFNMAYGAASELIGDEYKELIEGLFGNFQNWLTMMIEDQVRQQKI